MTTTDLIDTRAPSCDLETGLCALPSPDQHDAAERVAAPRRELLYVGDPMCSWCWGIAPGLHDVVAHADRLGIPLSIAVGGLRPGGGDPWNARFKAFLRHHWAEIGARSGQPFTFALLDRDVFNYDTEPAARAFVVMRSMLGEARAPNSRVHDVFTAIQRKFYVDGEDPTVTAFYESICAAHDLDYAEFVTRFGREDANVATAAEFDAVRKLGIRSFPTVLYRVGGDLHVLARGFATGRDMIERLDRILAGPFAHDATVRDSSRLTSGSDDPP